MSRIDISYNKAHVQHGIPPLPFRPCFTSFDLDIPKSINSILFVKCIFASVVDWAKFAITVMKFSQSSSVDCFLITARMFFFYSINFIRKNRSDAILKEARPIKIDKSMVRNTTIAICSHILFQGSLYINDQSTMINITCNWCKITINDHTECR